MESLQRSKRSANRTKCLYCNSNCNIKGITIMIIALFCLTMVDVFAFSTENPTNGWIERIDQETNVSNKTNIRSKMWSDEPSYQTAYACENEMLTINCSNEGEENEDGKRNGKSNSHKTDSSISLEIIRANFGRFSISICNKNSRADISVNCQSHSTLETIKNVCAKQMSSGICSVRAAPTIFLQDDPCPDTPKYLEVQYNCIKKQKSQNTSSIENKYLESANWDKREEDKKYMKKRKRVNDVRKRLSLNNSTKPRLFVTPTTPIPSHHLTTTQKYTKLRIPITVVPYIKKKAVSSSSSHSTISTSSNVVKKKRFEKKVTKVNKTEKNNNKNSIDDDDTTIINKDNKVNGINFITTKFLSSSIASTNIMDTSELPVSNFSPKSSLEEHSISSSEQAIINGSNSNTNVKADDFKKEHTQIDSPQITHYKINNQSTPFSIGKESYLSTSQTVSLPDVTKANKIRPLNPTLESEKKTIDFGFGGTYVSSSKPLIDPKHKSKSLFSPLEVNASNDTQHTSVQQPKQNHVLLKNDGKSKFCPRSTLGVLSWNDTEPNTIAATSCPNHSTGSAYRFCDPNGDWAENSVNLSQCISKWLHKIILDLQNGDRKLSIVHLSNIMSEYASRNHFQSGDISHLIETIEKLIDALRSELELIPTSSQREAVITQVVQNIIKTASVMVDLENHFLWQDIGTLYKQLTTLSAFITSLENAGLLLPEGAGENKEVTIASNNILLSAKKVNFRHMRGTTFPSTAATASRYWMDYEDRVEIPSMDLMKSMEMTGASYLILLAFKNIETLMDDMGRRSGTNQHIHTNVLEVSSADQMVINSQLVSFSFGSMETHNIHPHNNFKHLFDLKSKKSRKIPLVHSISENHSRLSVPLTIHFRHKLNHTEDNIAYPTCVFWDHHSKKWSSKDCGLLMTNRSHSTCACQKLGTYGLLMDKSYLIGNEMEMANEYLSATIIAIIVSSSVLVLLSILLIAIAVVYCRHLEKINAVKSSRLSLTADSSHKRLQEESSPSHVNFLLNGSNRSQFPSSSIQHSASVNSIQKIKFKNWFTNVLHNTFGCKSCKHRKIDNSSKRSQNIKPFTTDSSYTFQRSPQPPQPISLVENNQMTPDLLMDEDRNFTINSFTSNDRSPRRHGIVDFSLDSNTSPQYSSSLVSSMMEFERIPRSANAEEIPRSPTNYHRATTTNISPTIKTRNTSNPHIYAEVQEMSNYSGPEFAVNWQHQDLHHPLSQSMSEDNPQFESQSRCLDPIRQPLVSSHKYQKYFPSATMKQNENSNRHQILPQDCSMSSYSSGYDSMTQSPPSSKEGHLSTLCSRNQEASQQQMYSTNYDNVRGNLRGPFVSYTNNRK